MSFEALGLSENALNAIRKKGFSEPTDIQREVIPRLLEGGKNIIGQSQTGTGKTASFALPLIEMINEEDRYVQAIILTPTRELALQVADEIKSLRGRKKIKVFAVYGGQPIGPQIRILNRGVHIVVGTPGRVLDHMRRGTLKLNGIRYFILDEADRMLDMGFIDDIKIILRETPEYKRILMFSATMPAEILRLAEHYMRNYELIKTSEDELVPSLVEHEYIEVVPARKLSLLKDILDDDFYGIVFCQTKRETRELAGKLICSGYPAEALNGDMTQKARESTFWRFKKRKIKILVATDVAARGIDIQDITHVVNYSLPQNPDGYIHRIGRTGRAGKKGKAITLIMPGEYKKLRYIANVAGIRINKSELQGDYRPEKKNYGCYAEYRKHGERSYSPKKRKYRRY